MKRIDDKIKEIEKKDKINRLLFFGIIVLIIGFIYYASTTQKTIHEQEGTISSQEAKLKQQLIDLEDLNTKLNDTITLLKQSQTPVAFWNATKQSGITKSYLDYITHQGKPETQPEYIEMAIANIKKNSTEGKKAWIFCGRMESGAFKFDDNFAKIVWRANDSGSLSNLKPQKEDILENTLKNRYTYSDKNCTHRNDAPLAWNKGAKVFVTDVRESGNAVYLKLKF